jgi:hypothetical protein
MSLLADRRFNLAMRLLFWLACAFAVVMALLPSPPEVAPHIGDKIQHMVAFAVLAMLANLAFPLSPRLRLIERLSFLGALIEVAQSIPALHRDCDIFDWIADTSSVVVVTGLCVGLLALARRR